jgi:hypothetical protein
MVDSNNLRITPLILTTTDVETNRLCGLTLLRPGLELAGIDFVSVPFRPPEERHEVYKVLGLRVIAREDGNHEASIAYIGYETTSSVCNTELVSACCP